MTFTEALPTVNAALNGVATVLLTAGFVSIKTGRERSHRSCMLGALAVSIVFLFFYVLHKILVQGVHTPFQGEGLWRSIYYTMLVSHIILAMAVPLVLRTLFLAIKGERERHGLGPLTFLSVLCLGHGAGLLFLINGFSLRQSSKITLSARVSHYLPYQPNSLPMRPQPPHPLTVLLNKLATGLSRFLAMAGSMLAMLCIAGCDLNTRMSTFRTNGPVEEQYKLFMLTVAPLGIFIAVGGVYLYAVIKFRAPKR